MISTFLLMLRNALTVLGEVVVSILFFFGVSPESLQSLNLGYLEVGFIVAVIAVVGYILGMEAFEKIRNRN